MDVKVGKVSWNAGYATSMPLVQFISEHDGHYSYSHLSEKDRKKELTAVYKLCCKAEGKEFKAAPVKPESPEDNGGE